MRHGRLIAPLLALPFLLVALVGCDGDGCPEGQQQVQTGSIPVVTMVGKVPVVNNIPQYDCR